MYANILLSTDGSDVARKGVEHGIALAKALNAKVTVITVTEAPMLYLPTKADLVSWEEAREEHASKVLHEAPAGLIPMLMRRCEALLDVIESCGAIGEPQQVFQMIEEDLRARLAAPVEQKPLVNCGGNHDVRHAGSD